MAVQVEAPPASAPTADPGPVVGTLATAALGDASGDVTPALSARLARLWSGEGTDVRMLVSGILALGATALLYSVLLRPMAGTYVGDLFYERGAVPYAIAFLACWALTVLLLKLVTLSSQRRVFTVDLLPGGATLPIHPGASSGHLKRLRALPFDARHCFLVNRVILGLDHFGVRGDVSEVSGVLTTQRDIDEGRVDSSYTMLRVFVWAIPILGFIGTVLGIGGAVGSFNDTIATAGELDAMKQSLGQVTGGLAVAFDTTLLALVMSIVIMFPVHALQKAEEELLRAVDQYCNERLLRRLRPEERG